MRRLRTHLPALALAVLFTTAATWPLARDAATRVRDAGDPLLTSWILAWDVRALATGRIAAFFDANIFHPYPRTLAFSEHLFTGALVAAPVYLASGNPALANNVVSLFALATSFLGMYAFAFAATRSRAAGVAAGTIYAFSPFLLAQLSHVQSLLAGGLPLAMLFLHRWLRDRRWRSLGGFALCYVLQVLANGHYALYLTLLAGSLIAWEVMRAGRLREGMLWRQLGAFAIVSVLAVGPFFAPYLAAQRELGMKRWVTYEATFASFLAVHPENRLYGERLRENLGDAEDAMFPGLGALALAALGVAEVRRRRAPDATIRRRAVTLPLRTVLGAAALLTMGAVLAILAGGGEGVGFAVRHAANPSLLLALLLAARAAVVRAERREAGLAERWPTPLGWSERELVALYLAIAGAASLLAFGMLGPYSLLYRYVPGFDSLRVANRVHVVGTLALALLAAFGVAAAQARWRRWGRVLAVAAPLVALAESWMAPIALVPLPAGGTVPLVYRWLARQPGDFAILELPLPASYDDLPRVECPRVYFSTHHWKRLVNGYSGHLSPLYEELFGAWMKTPTFATVLRVLDRHPRARPRYVLLHPRDEMGFHERRALRDELARRTDRLRLVDRFERTVVYELLPAGAAPAPTTVAAPARVRPAGERPLRERPGGDAGAPARRARSSAQRHPADGAEAAPGRFNPVRRSAGQR